MVTTLPETAGTVLEREPEVGLAVEARLVDLHHPSRICALRPHPLSHSPHCGVRPHPLSPSPRCGEGGRPIEFDARHEACAQLLRGLHAEQRQVTRALGPLQLRDMLDQLQQLVLTERRRVERERIALPVAKVSLHAHGAQQEETDADHRGSLEAIGHRARAARRRPLHHGSGRAPRELGGLAARVAHAEAHALVGRVGPQVHHPASAFHVHLERVAAGVLVDSGLIPFVGRGVVEPRLREGEVGGDRVDQ